MDDSAAPSSPQAGWGHALQIIVKVLPPRLIPFLLVFAITLWTRPQGLLQAACLVIWLVLLAYAVGKAGLDKVRFSVNFRNAGRQGICMRCKGSVTGFASLGILAIPLVVRVWEIHITSSEALWVAIPSAVAAASLFAMMLEHAWTHRVHGVYGSPKARGWVSLFIGFLVAVVASFMLLLILDSVLSMMGISI